MPVQNMLFAIGGKNPNICVCCKAGPYNRPPQQCKIFPAAGKLSAEGRGQPPPPLTSHPPRPIHFRNISSLLKPSCLANAHCSRSKFPMQSVCVIYLFNQKHSGPGQYFGSRQLHPASRRLILVLSSHHQPPPEVQLGLCTHPFAFNI